MDNNKPIKNRRSRKPDAEDKSLYYRMKNKTFYVGMRLTSEQHSLLEIQMKREGWDSVTGYVKYKIFGLRPDLKTSQILKGGDPVETGIMLRDSVLALTSTCMYIRRRYEKDMNQLWREEGVDLDKWKSATNRWNRETALRMEETLSLCRDIARALRLDEYFRMPSDDMGIDPATASQEELDTLAEQLRVERTAMGRTDEL